MECLFYRRLLAHFNALNDLQLCCEVQVLSLFHAVCGCHCLRVSCAFCETRAHNSTMLTYTTPSHSMHNATVCAGSKARRMNSANEALPLKTLQRATSTKNGREKEKTLADMRCAGCQRLLALLAFTTLSGHGRTNQGEEGGKKAIWRV